MMKSPVFFLDPMTGFGTLGISESAVIGSVIWSREKPFQDMEANCGFLHRLDVPCSGLVPRPFSK